MKCYVWNCHEIAVILIEMPNPPYHKLPYCQKHADEFPSEYARIELSELKR
jgi:hypothetical protein